MSFRRNLDVRRTKSSLVATFGKANPPLIWRFDLERNHSFTLGLQGDDGEWELGVTSPKGEFYPVARFPVREDADEAFAGVSDALARGSARGLWPVVKFLIGFVIVAILAWMALATVTNLLHMIWQNHRQNEAAMSHPPVPPAPPPPQAQEQPPAPTPAPAPPPLPDAGIPMPADNVLKPPSP